MFERQIPHLVLTAILVAAAAFAAGLPGVLDGEALGLPTVAWFWAAIATPLLHQGFVWLVWRLELYGGRVSATLGPMGFRLYCVGFALWSLLRFVTLVGLAVANRDTLAFNRWILYGIAAVFTALHLYLMYSVVRYFTMKRAVGGDHFFEAYRTMPLESRGIFRFTSNGMYTAGLLILWVPGLLAASKAAILAALFSHISIWIHYYCTELPDLRRIYGERLTK